MAPKWTFSNSGIWLQRLALGCLAVCFLGALSARADLVVSVGSTSVDAGTTDNPLDVELTNTGPAAITIGGFTFGVSVGNSNISFTDANTSTVLTYIFEGNSLFGPDLTGPTSGQSLDTSDVFAGANNGTTLGAGTTLGIGHLLFDVSALAGTGAFAVSLSAPFTSVSDINANTIPIDSLSAGKITIEGPSEIPEPGTMGILLAGVAAIAGARRLRKAV